jgi:hypothetical protein
MLSARETDLQLGQVPDNRTPYLIKWQLPVVLRTVLVCLCAGARSLAQAEQLTAEMTPTMRRTLALRGRIPDTTMRTIIAGQEPDHIRAVMHRQIRAAARRGALSPVRQPFNTVMIDGKVTPLPSCDDDFAQRQTRDGKLVGMLRTMTCALVTTAAQPCIDAIPIPASTNEMGCFRACVDALMQAYGSIDLFRLVAADAGNCCEANARHVRSKGLHYLFGLKGNQPTLEAEARRLLGDVVLPAACTTDIFGHSRRVERRLFLTGQIAGFEWDHLRTVVRVESRCFVHGKLEQIETRYFVTSLPVPRLAPSQWLELVRLQWGVENAVHCTLDKMMREDEHPWIESDPKGALIVALLRRIAYNLLALYRAVTLRAECNRSTPWSKLMRWVELALLTAGPHDVARLRARTPAAASPSQVRPNGALALCTAVSHDPPRAGCSYPAGRLT